MKKIISCISALLLFCGGLRAQSFTAVNSDGVTINYEVLSTDEHTVAVATYGYTGRVMVPETVEYNGTVWTVTSIGTAFKNKPVTHLGLPATVTALQNSAFEHCSQLDTVWLASEAPVSVPKVGGYYRPERIFFAGNQTATLYVGTVIVTPCGSLSDYRREYWRSFPTLTSTCAVPITVLPMVDSVYRFDSLVYRENGKPYVHFSNRYYEVGDTAQVKAERWKKQVSGGAYTYPRYGWFIGWSNGISDLDFSFVVEQADTIICIVDTFHYEYLTASRITTPVYQFGTLSYDGNNANYRFDNLGNASSLFASALWVGSNDSLSYLRDYWMLQDDSTVSPRVATARFMLEGTDFFPGPLRLADGGTDIATLMAFNRVWKVSREMVDYHIAHCAEAGYQPAEAILSWPGNGPDGYASQLAPYYDADNDGVYNPLHGDYPVIRGDECVFSIFNDVYGTHGESGGKSLGIEVHSMAYAFNEPADTALWNTVFLHYDIFNRSGENLPNTFFGAWSDFDLGYAWDDFIGCDVKNGMYYAYNGRDVDGPGINSFAGVPPAQGCIILGGATLPSDGQDNPKINIPYILNAGANPVRELLQEYSDGNGGYDIAALSRDAQLFYLLDPYSWYFSPGDTLGNMSLNGMNFGDGIVDNERMGLTNFVYYENSVNSINGEPSGPSDYYNYMHSYWKNHQRVKYAGNGISLNTTEEDASFMFPDDSDPWHWGTNGVVPSSNPDDWNEITAGNTPGDRRGIGACGPFNFAAGTCQQFDIAYTTGFGTETSWSSVQALRRNNINVRRQFVRDTTDSNRPFVYRPYSAPHHEGIGQADNLPLHLYPNPTTGIVTIDLPARQTVELYDMTGRLLTTVTGDGRIQLDLSSYAAGVYILRSAGTATRILKR